MTRRLAIFDVDGTLIDSQDHIVAAMRHAFAHAQLDVPDRQRLLSIVGLSLREVFETLAPSATPQQRRGLERCYREAFVRHREAAGIVGEAPLFPGAADALSVLGTWPGTALGVATGKAKRGVEHMMRVHAFEAVFQTVQTADGHPSKPHPSMVLRALQETGTAPSDAVMIGDTEFDIAMGRAAGVRTIGVTWGYHPVARLRDAGADAVVSSFDDLLAHIEGHWAGKG